MSGSARFVALVLIWLSAYCTLPSSSAIAGGGPENVLLVVNRASDSSKMFANHYIHLRDIPARNVVYLDDIPNTERIKFSDFKSVILMPILETVQDRGLTGNIDYIVYSTDFPTIVWVRGPRDSFLELINDVAAERGGVTFGKKMFNPWASITSMTYFTAYLINNDVSYFTLDSNSYYRGENRGLLTRPFAGETQEQFEDAVEDSRNGNLDEAISVFEELAAEHPNQVAVCYWLSRTYATKEEPVESARWLARAVSGGWAFKDYTASDLAFEKVRRHEAFKSVLDRMPNQNFRFYPTHGFRGSYRWGPNGMINSTTDQGSAYVLSTVLGVTRNRGINEANALAGLIRSCGADSTFPDGKVIFTETNDVRSQTRSSTFNDTIRELQTLGVEGTVLGSAFPRNRPDIIGMSTGTARFDINNAGNTIVPGAICENLTSFGGEMAARPNQTKLTAFLKHGAAGSSGTVVEPYAIGNKFPHTRIHCHYARGCSLAEAYYQSVHGPFQLLIVGDALCQPWAVRPSFTIDGFESGEEVSGDVSFSMNYDDSPVPVAGVEVYLDGQLVRRYPRPDNVNFDSNAYSDGFHEIRLVAVAANEIETQRNLIIPFTVSNNGDSVTLDCDVQEIDWEDTVSLSATTNCGDEIRLMQNSEIIATGPQSNVIFRVSGRKLGRGPVTLRAVVLKDGKEVSSQPLSLTVNGAASTSVPRTTETIGN